MEKVEVGIPSFSDGKSGVNVSKRGLFNKENVNYDAYLSPPPPRKGKKMKQRNVVEPVEEEADDCLKYADEEKVKVPKKQNPLHPVDEEQFEQFENEQDDSFPEREFYREREYAKPEIIVEEDDAAITEKALTICRLERKIKIHNLNIQIPLDAPLKTYKGMLSKITYELESGMYVEFLKSAFVTVNAFVEEWSNHTPKLALELQGWGTACTALITKGEFEEVFFEIYDYYKEYFHTHPVAKLACLWVTKIVWYSQTQKLFIAMNAVRKQQATSQGADLEPPPSVSQEKLEKLRQQAKQAREETVPVPADDNKNKDEVSIS